MHGKAGLHEFPSIALRTPTFLTAKKRRILKLPGDEWVRHRG